MTEGKHIKIDFRRNRAELFASQVMLAIGDLIENRGAVRERLVEKAYDADVEIVYRNGEQRKVVRD